MSTLAEDEADHAGSTTAIVEIAFDAGYETHEAFTRAFRASYAMSPTEFRQRARPRVEIAAACGIHFAEDGQVPAFIPRDSGGRIMHVELKQMPALRVGTIRHLGPYNQINQAFERLGAIAGPRGLFAQPGAAMLAIYHDDPESVPPDKLRSDAAIAVSESVTLPPELVEQRIPAGTYASTVHVGSYERLGDTWARLMGEWIPAHGRRIAAGVSYEIYVKNPMTTPTDQLLTELYVPVEP